MRGTLYAWGCGEQAVLGCRLGASRPKAKLLPTQPLALRRGRASLPVVSAAAGAYHSLALTADGEVWAWGLNNHGQLGCGGFAATTAPQPVAALRGLRVEQLDGGEHHSLARVAKGPSGCRLVGATAHRPGLPGLALQARGCAMHSGRAAGPPRAEWEAAARP